MTGDQVPASDADIEIFENQRRSVEFLPDLCAPASVFSLVLVGELLAFALVLARSPLGVFDWADLGLTSVLVQWVMLSSAASLCPLRAVLNRLSPAQAVGVSYGVILVFTAVFSVMGLWFVGGTQRISGAQLFTNLAIAAIFAGVVLRYLYLQALLKQREQAELNARVQALQSRIRPHFLFNSLNSIASLIAIKPVEAEILVVDLAHIFRASLKSPQLTPITSEIAVCKRFAKIEQARMGKRLKIEWRIGELPESAQILNLLMQPLLENAIYHGVQPLTGGGTVVIDINIVNDKGTDDIVIKIFNPRLPGDATRYGIIGKDGGNGIALSNIRQRLDAVYKRKAYLRVVKGATDFTVVVRYPLKKN